MNADALILAHDSKRPEPSSEKAAGNALNGGVGNENPRAEVFVQPFKSGGEIDGVAYEGVIEPILGTKVASEHLASVHSHASREVVSEHFFFRSKVHLPRCERSFPRVIVVRQGRSPNREHGIADV